LLLRRRGRAAFEPGPGHEPQQIGVVAVVVEEAAGVSGKVVGVDRHSTDGVLREPLQHGVEESVLVAEVVVDEALVRARRSGDSVHSRTGDAVSDELGRRSR